MLLDLIETHAIAPALRVGDRVRIEHGKALGRVLEVDAAHGLARVRTNGETVTLPCYFLELDEA